MATLDSGNVLEALLGHLRPVQETFQELLGCPVKVPGVLGYSRDNPGVSWEYSSNVLEVFWKCLSDVPERFLFST